MLRTNLILILAAGALAGSLLSAQDKPLVAKGQALTTDHKCAMCHVLGGKGGKLSKSLDGVSDRHAGAALKQILEDPQGMFPSAKIKMPKVAWKPGEVDAVVAYLQSLKAVSITR
jgi:cytochrome c2